MSEKKLNILLADDQNLFAESLRTFLNNYAEDMNVIAIATNGQEAVSLAEQYHPDIILMDIRMPVMDGVEAVRKIKRTSPEIRIIMLSTYNEDAFVYPALQAGASGYLLKDMSPTELIAAIRALKNGGTMQISPEIVRQLIQERYSSLPKSKLVRDGQKDEKGQSGSSTEEISHVKSIDVQSFEWLRDLTNREREIFTLIAIGYDNEKISEKLNLAVQTVRNQVSTIYFKLGVKDRFEIIRLANKIHEE
jgi:DNA-binding NarL/FixJ family response regulator